MESIRLFRLMGQTDGTESIVKLMGLNSKNLIELIRFHQFAPSVCLVGTKSIQLDFTNRWNCGIVSVDKS